MSEEMFAQRMFQLAVEACPSGMVMTDGAGNIVMVNSEVERLFGYQREELIGQPVELLIPARLNSQHVRHREKFSTEPDKRHAGVGRNLAGLHKDGTEFPVEVRLNPIQTREGLLILSVIVDITERSLAEEKFRLAVEACPNGMMMIDRDGRMVMANTEIEQQFGYLHEELIGQSVDMLVPERLRAEYARHREAFNRRPQSRRIGASPDLLGLRKDGSEFPIEIGLTRIRTSKGSLILGVIVNVSERKRTERLKDEFVSTVSHELRTPLTSISGSLGLLVGQWGGTLPDSAARLLAIAHKNCQRLVRLINDILDIDKMESGRVVFNVSRVDVLALVEQAIEGNRGYAEGYGVRIRLDATSTAGEVNADPDRLAQVVTNLLSNAIKFSPANDEVVVTVEKNGDAVRVSVRDHGPGIPDEFRSHMFEKFAQADAADNRQKGGSGLGLSIAKQIVERLGGTVGFHDVPDGGTIFHIELPAWDSAAGGRIDLETEIAPARILHLDDDHEVLAVVADALRTTAEMTSVDSIANARRALANNCFDLAVLDISLGTGSGLDLLPDLHDSQGNAIPVIVFSAQGAVLTFDEQIEVALAKSSTSLDTLVATVRDRLAHSRALASKEVA